MTTPDADPSIRLQIIWMEMAELQAHRQMAWTESTNRASMFMTILGAAVFGLALVGNATNFDTTFLLVSLLVLPILLFVGISSLARLSELNAHDWILLQGLNRLRSLRTELDPTIRPHLMLSAHDDFESVLDAYGPVNPKLHSFWTLDALIGTLVAVLAAFIGGLISISAGLGAGVAATVGVVTFVAVMALIGLAGYRSFVGAMRDWVSENPAPKSLSTGGPPTPSA